MKNHRTIDLKKNGLKYFLGRGCITFFLVFISITSSHAQWNVEIGNTSLFNNGKVKYRYQNVYIQGGYQIEKWNFGICAYGNSDVNFKYGAGLFVNHSFDIGKSKRVGIYPIAQLGIEKYNRNNKGPYLLSLSCGAGVSLKLNSKFSLTTQYLYGRGKWLPEVPEIDKYTNILPFYFSLGVKYTFTKKDIVK